MRVAAWIAGTGAAVATVALSVVSAHAFKGHARTTGTTAPQPPRSAQPRARIQVPPAQAVPSIDGDPAPLQPPAQAPDTAPVPPQDAPAPPVSGGS